MDGLRIGEVTCSDVVALGRVDEGLGHSVGLGAIGRCGDRAEPQGLAVEDRIGRGVRAAVVGANAGWSAAWRSSPYAADAFARMLAPQNKGIRPLDPGSLTLLTTRVPSRERFDDASYLGNRSKSGFWARPFSRKSRELPARGPLAATPNFKFLRNWRPSHRTDALQRPVRSPISLSVRPSR